MKPVAEPEAPISGGARSTDRLPGAKVVDKHFNDEAVRGNNPKHAPFKVNGAGGCGAARGDAQAKPGGDTLKDKRLRDIVAGGRGPVGKVKEPGRPGGDKRGKGAIRPGDGTTNDFKASGPGDPLQHIDRSPSNGEPGPVKKPARHGKRAVREGPSDRSRRDRCKHGPGAGGQPIGGSGKRKQIGKEHKKTARESAYLDA